MHWDVGPAEAAGVLTAAWLGVLKLRQKINGGTIKERLARLETKVDLILASMKLEMKE